MRILSKAAVPFAVAVLALLLSVAPEIDVIPFAAGGGQNLGWPHLEGFVDPGLGLTCGQGNTFTDPVYVYENGGGASVIAGQGTARTPARTRSRPSTTAACSSPTSTRAGSAALWRRPPDGNSRRRSRAKRTP